MHAYFLLLLGKIQFPKDVLYWVQAIFIDDRKCTILYGIPQNIFAWSRLLSEHWQNDEKPVFYLCSWTKAERQDTVTPLTKTTFYIPSVNWSSLSMCCRPLWKDSLVAISEIKCSRKAQPVAMGWKGAFKDEKAPFQRTFRIPRVRNIAHFRVPAPRRLTVFRRTINLPLF